VSAETNARTRPRLTDTLAHRITKYTAGSADTHPHTHTHRRGHAH